MLEIHAVANYCGCFFLLCMRLGVRVIILTSMLISTLHVLIVFSGILSSMGDACFRCHFWFPSYARSNGNHCRASILLFDCFASTCNGKDLIKDSKIGVSLNYFVLLLGKVYLSVCNSNLQVLNVLSSLKISSTRVPLSWQALLLSFLLHQEVLQVESSSILISHYHSSAFHLFRMQSSSWSHNGIIAAAIIQTLELGLWQNLPWHCH